MTSCLVDAAAVARLQRQQKLIDLYLFVVDRCLRKGREQWWREAVSLPFADEAQGVEHLKNLCFHELLCGAGDFAAFDATYRVLAEEGWLAGDERARYLHELVRFVRPLLVVDPPRQPFRLRLGSGPASARPGAVVSIVLPDAAALAGLKDLALPSFESEDGLLRLAADRDVTILVFVAEHILEEAWACFDRKEVDCSVVCRAIPESLCAGADIVAGGVQRDWLTGALQCVHLVEARQFNADFYSVNPHGIYSSGYLGRLREIAKGQPAVLSAAIWVNNRGLFDRYATRDRTRNLLSVAARDLTATGLNVLGPYACSAFVEGFVAARGPLAHLRATWVSRDWIEIHSTSHELLYVSCDVVSRMPGQLLLRPSVEFDRILGPADVPYFVQEGDGITVAEFGHPPGSFHEVTAEGTGGEGIAGRLCRPQQAALFKHAVRLPLARHDGLEGPDGLTERPGALHLAFSRLIDRAAAPAALTIDQALSALHVLHHYETSEYGMQNMAQTIEEGRRLLGLGSGPESAFDGNGRRELIRAAMNFDRVELAIELARNGGAETSLIHEFLASMVELKRTNVARANELRRKLGRTLFQRRPMAVIGSIVWGERFVEKFMDYHVASLLARGNIPSLARHRKVVHSIVTTEADRQRVMAHPLFEHLGKHAEVVFTCFPEKFIEQREREGYNFYQFYGLLDHQSVFLAAALQAELYLLPVDIVLSDHSLSNLSRRLGRVDGCSVAGIECEPADLRAWLDARPRGRNGELELSAGELLSEAIALPDAYFRSLFMVPDNRSFCRHPRELIWPRADGLAIHSIFMHPIAVSSRLMSRPFHPQHENVDFALLPRLLQGDGTFEVVQDATEVAAAQFGAPAGREEFIDGGFSVEAFVEAHRHDYAVQRRCFAARQFFPCRNSGAPESTGYETEVALIEKALTRYRFQADQ